MPLCVVLFICRSFFVCRFCGTGLLDNRPGFTNLLLSFQYVCSLCAFNTLSRSFCFFPEKLPLTCSFCSVLFHISDLLLTLFKVTRILQRAQVINPFYILSLCWHRYQLEEFVYCFNIPQDLVSFISLGTTMCASCPYLLLKPKCPCRCSAVYLAQLGYLLGSESITPI